MSELEVVRELLDRIKDSGSKAEVVETFVYGVVAGETWEDALAVALEEWA